jgi:hypothetical protein
VSTPAQLALVDVPVVPSLTPRQQRALEVVQAAGSNGIHADELGAILHEEYGRHSRDQRCQYDGSNGRQLLDRLKKDGLVKQRRPRGLPTYWVAVDAKDVRPMPGMTDVIPY